jgi:hypothetical protein
MRGFEELATKLAGAADGSDALRALCSAYLDFAASKPVVYEAMFVLPTELLFAREETPATMRAAFAALLVALGPDREEPVFTAELLWSALHGLVNLEQSGRIPAAGAKVRRDILVRKFSNDH